MSELSDVKQALLEARLRQERAARARRDQIEPVPRSGLLPVSEQQRHLWQLDELAPGLPADTMPIALRLRGGLDVAALRRALTALAARHESLRTRFGSARGVPFQIIDPPGETEVPLPVSGAADEAELARLAADELRRPLDLASGPLFRARLLRLAPRDHTLLLSIHHIVTDGWSNAILTSELATLYQGGELPPLAIQPADYAVWQRRRLAGDVAAAQLGYWRGQLADLPVVDLITDHPRSSSRTWCGDMLARTLPDGLGTALNELAAREQAPLLAVLLAAFVVVLHRYTGQADLAVGSVVKGRSRPELEPLAGFFANTLVLRTDASGDPAFTELVARCRDTVRGALEHQDIPFGRLVDELKPDRDPGRNPLFQISFTLQDGSTAGGRLELGDLAAEPVDISRGGSRLDLGFTVIARDDGPLRLLLEYSTELFERGRMAGLAEHFRQVLEQVAADPGVRAGRLAVLTAAERERLLEQWNPPPRRFASHGQLLHELVPADDRPAVRFTGQTLTYAGLTARSDRLARVLAARGVGPGVVAGVLLERGFELPVAQLAVMKAGGAWLPLDPAHPRQRLAFQLSDTGAPVVVTTRDLAERLPPEIARICLDDPHACDGQATAPAAAARPRDPAYVIYTSGSTGTPKGVVVSHQSVVNFVSAIGEQFSIGRHDRLLQFANPSFDVSIFDIYAALCHGATVVAAPRPVLLDPASLTGLMAGEKVTIADIPPAVLGLLNPDDLPDLRVLWVGLEAFPAELVNAWNRGGRQFHNGYGPTEATVACVNYRCPPGVMTGNPPIGRAMANHRVYILDSQQNLVPPGVPGELHIAGAGLALGYLNQPAQTAERFLPDLFGPAPGMRMYRTGDMVRWREDGLLEFLGRADRQVKIRGLRIELTEIEHVLKAQPGIRQAAVTIGDQDQLVAYAVTETPPDETALLEALARQLPLHMVPTAIVYLDTLPLTTSGKLDHSKLPPLTPPGDQSNTAPQTPTEHAIARIWAAILNVPAASLTLHDSFFALGGNSLRTVQLLARLNTEFAVELDLRTLVTNPALHQLAVTVDALRAEAEAEAAGPAGRQDEPARPSPVITISAHGAGEPCFLVHAAGDSIVTYLPFGPLLDRPVFALEAAGLHGGTPVADLREMAWRYVAEVRRIRPHGPYLLGGWSLGGVISVEMARLLLADGQAVAPVALLDSALPPGQADPPPRDELLRLFVADLAGITGLPAPELDVTGMETLLPGLEDAGLLASGLRAEARARVATYLANVTAFRLHRVEPLEVSVLLVRAADDHDEDLAARWAAVALGGVREHVVPGTHYTIMRADRLAAFAGMLEAAWTSR